MKIVGFNISKFLIERKTPGKGEINIKNNLEITDIAKEELNISTNQALKFDFSYSIEYTPNLANLEIKGSVITIDEKDESKEILKTWKDGKKFNHDFKIAILNFIINKCSLKALQMEEELGLPLHLPFPKISDKSLPQVSENKAKYTG